MVLGAIVIVIVGMLVVNYFKDRNAETIPALTTQNEIGGEHVVVAGETLWSIAEDNYGSGYNWVDVSEENGLVSDKIEVGQSLSIPDVAARQPTATKLTTTLETDTAIGADSYTVVKGDDLWHIAVRTYGDGYQWVRIAEANSLKNPDVIHAGNILTLPR